MPEPRTASQEEWDTAQAKPPDEWDGYVDRLDNGEILAFPIADQKERLGIGLRLGRKASSRGFKIQTLPKDDELLVRKSDEPYVPKLERGRSLPTEGEVPERESIAP